MSENKISAMRFHKECGIGDKCKNFECWARVRDSDRVFLFPLALAFKIPNTSERNANRHAWLVKDRARRSFNTHTCGKACGFICEERVARSSQRLREGSFP